MADHFIRQSFQSLYDAEADSIFRFCSTRVSSREQALDIVQETFLKLWLSLQKGQVITNHRAFLYTIAQRLIIDWYRKKKSLSLDEPNGSDDEAPEPADEKEHERLWAKAEGRFLLDKLRSMREPYRAVLHLRFVEGFSPSEIASTLKISANAVSVRIARGIDELRRLTGYDISQNDHEQ